MNRREVLALPAVAAAATSRTHAAPRKRIAAIVTTYHVRSHADNVVTRFLEGYWLGGTFHPSPCDVVSLYMDQRHPADIGERLASAYGFQVVRSVADALTLGTGKLAVDGVVLVAEHGQYPFNDRGQQLYPRFELYAQVVDVFRASRRAVPVYVDKHLSYDWSKARRMYDWSRELGFPLMAGSSIPVTYRRPALDPPLGSALDDALVVAGGWVTDGGVFHDLEALQGFVERRRGGETGVRAVQRLQGDAVWKAAADGRWSRALLEAALGRAEKPHPGRPRDAKEPVLCLLEYNDGFHAAALMLGGVVGEYLVALSTDRGRRIDSTLCYVPDESSDNFSNLVHGIARMFTTGAPPYPVERTLLTTGALAALMESAHRGGQRVPTPELKVTYTAPLRSWFAEGRG